MYKPASLRAHLLAKIQGLSPDLLLTFISDGHVAATAAGAVSFEYSYTLHIVITDHAGSSDAVMIALLQWLRVHQVNLFNSREEMARAFTFEVDILNAETYDLGIKLLLTERVGVQCVEGVNVVEHFTEPALIDAENIDPSWTA